MSPEKFLKMPGGFYIGVGLAIIGLGWIVSSMAGCFSDSQKARYEYLQKSGETFWKSR